LKPALELIIQNREKAKDTPTPFTEDQKPGGSDMQNIIARMRVPKFDF
jgi:hypothetical protein